MKIFYKSQCMHDMADSLTHEYLNNHENSGIILGAWSYRDSIDDIKKKLNIEKLIIFNTESYDSHFFEDTQYIYLLKNADEVWDYDEDNIQHLNTIRNDIKLHILKPYIHICPKEKKYDVLFVGCINNRRQKILNDLINNGINVKIFTYGENELYGDELNDSIASSKILLNIHYYEAALQEQARMCKWLGNGIIISEKSKHNYLHVHEVEYDNIVETVINELKNSAQK